MDATDSHLAGHRNNIGCQDNRALDRRHQAVSPMDRKTPPRSGQPDARGERASEASKSFVDRGVNVIVASATPAIAIAKEAPHVRKFPIAMAPVADPLATGFADSVAPAGRPSDGLVDERSQSFGQAPSRHDAMNAFLIPRKFFRAECPCDFTRPDVGHLVGSELKSAQKTSDGLGMTHLTMKHLREI